MTRLSNRQYPMLQVFHDLKPDEFLSLDDAQSYDQRPFRSMLVRKWIVYRAGKGFHITREGRAAWTEFLTTDIARKDPTRPLTAYFDPTAYGLRKVRVMPRRGAAA